MSTPISLAASSANSTPFDIFAGTVFNFSSPGANNSQSPNMAITSDPRATATATTGSAGGGSTHPDVTWWEVLLIAGAVWLIAKHT